jgi:hypothetical protein
MLDELHRVGNSTNHRMFYAIKNIYYGLTEAELKQWMSLPYLLRIPEREFQNNITQGFFGNLIDSIYAMLGLSGF